MGTSEPSQDDRIVPLRERLERLRHVRLNMEDRRLAVEAEEIATDDPDLVAWALVVLLRWQE